MLYTDLTKKAMEICFEAHKEQVDKGGMPYVFHPLHLAEQIRPEEESAEEKVCAALLHDVAEDTDRTLEDLAAEGFPPTVMEALRLLTHEKGTPYLEYVRSLSSNPIAARVKLEDLRHNSMPGRLSSIRDTDVRRLRKYLLAQAILTGAEVDPDQMQLRFRFTVPALQRTAASGKPETSKTKTSLSYLNIAGNVGESAASGKPETTKTSGAAVTVCLNPDGRTAGYGVREEAGQENETWFESREELLNELGNHGFSEAAAAEALQKIAVQPGFSHIM